MLDILGYVGRTKHLYGPFCLAIVKHQFRQRERGNSIAGILLDERLAYVARTHRLSVPHEHPCDRQQELSLFVSQLTTSLRQEVHP